VRFQKLARTQSDAITFTRGELHEKFWNTPTIKLARNNFGVGSFRLLSNATLAAAVRGEGFLRAGARRLACQVIRVSLESLHLALLYGPLHFPGLYQSVSRQRLTFPTSPIRSPIAGALGSHRVSCGKRTDKVTPNNLSIAPRTEVREKIPPVLRKQHHRCP
jgi:hypothetical protein